MRELLAARPDALVPQQRPLARPHAPCRLSFSVPN
jgi:hypothetical protein